MRRKPSDRFLRLSVRYVDGSWELASGGAIPVFDGAEAELIVNQKQITDPSFVKHMKSRDKIKFLDEGAKLFAYVVVREKDKIPERLRSHLVPFSEMQHRVGEDAIDNWSSGELCFVPVTIGALSEKQLPLFPEEKGGMWLIIEGRESAGLKSSQINLPEGVADGPVISLNHAFTRLSEVFEPWRKSHTGNVYHRFLYEEADKKLYPLELLRDAALAKQDQSIAYKLWQDFLKKTAARKQA